MTLEQNICFVDLLLQMMEILVQDLRIQKMEPEQKRLHIATTISLLHDVQDILRDVENALLAPPIV